eukprot:TRINITY_DN96_c0_g1_i1.p1 TRINITY_DN96_c0_g1~~TRINITY_DN96_c0_g1_i1.p1  ORF type:complete len:1564 (+),score=284.82 TRINITY_DN96_c0_g1_i1:517-4692(+)
MTTINGKAGDKPSTHAQELLHTFGAAGHANTIDTLDSSWTQKEYGDVTDFMGGAAEYFVCPGFAYQEAFQWITESSPASVVVLADALPALKNQPTIVCLDKYAADPKGMPLVIKLDATGFRAHANVEHPIDGLQDAFFYVTLRCEGSFSKPPSPWNGVQGGSIQVHYAASGSFKNTHNQRQSILLHTMPLDAPGKTFDAATVGRGGVNGAFKFSVIAIDGDRATIAVELGGSRPPTCASKYALVAGPDLEPFEWATTRPIDACAAVRNQDGIMFTANAPVGKQLYLWWNNETAAEVPKAVYRLSPSCQECVELVMDDVFWDGEASPPQGVAVTSSQMTFFYAFDQPGRYFVHAFVGTATRISASPSSAGFSGTQLLAAQKDLSSGEDPFSEKPGSKENFLGATFCSCTGTYDAIPAQMPRQLLPQEPAYPLRSHKGSQRGVPLVSNRCKSPCKNSDTWEKYYSNVKPDKPMNFPRQSNHGMNVGTVGSAIRALDRRLVASAQELLQSGAVSRHRAGVSAGDLDARSAEDPFLAAISEPGAFGFGSPLRRAALTAGGTPRWISPALRAGQTTVAIWELAIVFSAEEWVVSTGEDRHGRPRFRAARVTDEALEDESPWVYALAMSEDAFNSGSCGTQCCEFPDAPLFMDDLSVLWQGEHNAVCRMVVPTSTTDFYLALFNAFDSTDDLDFATQRPEAIVPLPLDLHPSGDQRRAEVDMGNGLSVVMTYLLEGAPAARRAAQEATCAAPIDLPCDQEVEVTLRAHADTDYSSGCDEGYKFSRGPHAWFRLDLGPEHIGAPISISTCDSAAIDTTLQVYFEECGTADYCVTHNDDFCGASGLGSAVRFVHSYSKDAGRASYFIQVAGYEPKEGQKMPVVKVRTSCNASAPLGEASTSTCATDCPCARGTLSERIEPLSEDAEWTQNVLEWGSDIPYRCACSACDHATEPAVSNADDSSTVIDSSLFSDPTAAADVRRRAGGDVLQAYRAALAASRASADDLLASGENASRHSHSLASARHGSHADDRLRYNVGPALARRRGGSAKVVARKEEQEARAGAVMGRKMAALRAAFLAAHPEEGQDITSAMRAELFDTVASASAREMEIAAATVTADPRAFAAAAATSRAFVATPALVQRRKRQVLPAAAPHGNRSTVHMSAVREAAPRRSRQLLPTAILFGAPESGWEGHRRAAWERTVGAGIAAAVSARRQSGSSNQGASVSVQLMSDFCTANETACAFCWYMVQQDLCVQFDQCSCADISGSCPTLLSNLCNANASSSSTSSSTSSSSKKGLLGLLGLLGIIPILCCCCCIALMVLCLCKRCSRKKDAVLAMPDTFALPQHPVMTAPFFVGAPLATGTPLATIAPSCVFASAQSNAFPVSQMMQSMGTMTTMYPSP